MESIPVHTSEKGSVPNNIIVLTDNTTNDVSLSDNMFIINQEESNDSMDDCTSHFGGL